jgi:hypothetical protein
MSTRRAILKVGGAAIVIAGAGAAYWTLTRSPRRALAPWSAAGGSFGDARLDALSYAILAPNPHNMQPWRVRLDGEDAFTLYAELSRLLPETDPPNRQITIGFGAFLELFRQAAAEKGLRAEMVYFPEGEARDGLDERPVARVRLVEDGAVLRDPLFGGVLDRRTSRQPFEARPVDRAALDAVKAATVDGVFADATVEAERVAALKALAREAWEIEWGLARTRMESIRVTRIGKTEIEAEPWGIALAGPVMEAAGLAGVLTREAMDDPEKAGYGQTLSFYNAAIDSARGFLWSTTTTNARRDQLEAGRAWVRMHLAAQAQGLAVHPLSQALQEFPEMGGPYERAHALLASGGGIVQMLARLGYAKPAPPAPRESLEAKLVPA